MNILVMLSLFTPMVLLAVKPTKKEELNQGAARLILATSYSESGQWLKRDVETENARILTGRKNGNENRLIFPNYQEEIQGCSLSDCASTCDEKKRIRVSIEAKPISLTELESELDLTHIEKK